MKNAGSADAGPANFGYPARCQIKQDDQMVHDLDRFRITPGRGFA